MVTMWSTGSDCSVATSSTGQASYLLLALGGTVLVTALVLATVLSGTPVDQLGLRPIKGSGVWSWCLASLREGVGVYGYDAVQGAMAPPLRLQLHLAAILLLWGGLSLWFGTSSSSSTECLLDLPLSVWWMGAIVTGGYLGTMYILHHVLPGVSTPGGPRDFKMKRTPEWSDETTCADVDATQWKCVVAQASHEDTHAKFPNSKLTGEACGRQIWSPTGVSSDDDTTTTTNTETKEEDNKEDFLGNLWHHVSGVLGDSNNSNNHDDKEKDQDTTMVDEALVQTMAQGGRDSFGFNPSKNPNSCDMVFRAQQIRNYLRKGGQAPNISSSADETQEHQKTTVHEATKKGTHFYSMLQCEDGHWAADYGGPHFLMPGMVTAWYVMGRPTNFLNDRQIQLLIHYILVHQQTDGGWGTHLESPSTMFGSTLMYVALRLMGIPKDHPAATKGRAFLQDQGGALYTSSWSKFYLCLLGCMDWQGHNSVPPEMWLLPNWCPFHPGRMWCHARMVYLPMGYLYGTRFVYEHAETDPIIQSLREELYCEPYDSIVWMPTRQWVAEMDNYSPLPFVMKVLQNILARYETWAVVQPFKKWVRQKGLNFSMDYIRAEDLQTNYLDIGPVNKVLNMISHYHATGGNLEDPTIISHLMRVQDYLWVAEDGMKMQGYNGSQCWDTSFCAQAMYDANLMDDFPQVTRKIWGYLERTQILSTEVSRASPAYQFESNQYRNKFYRHISEGGWPFSTSAHGWPISDCTGEGLKATLCLLKSKAVQAGLQDESLKQISDERLYKAVNVLLAYQNEDGGWATYENNRGWGWYEQLNPSEVFGDIMIDYSYVECSMAALTAMVDFREVFPEHRVNDLQNSIEKGCAFLKSIQRSDGSWYGSWACCFSYGIWFGVEGLVKCGEPVDSPCILRACEFLLKHQRPNGGWGEDFTSCYDKDYAKEGMKAYGDDGSGIVNTSWALLALSMAKCKDVDAIRRGVQYLIKRQLPCGDWPQEGISGVFNRSVGITYTAYRNVFPIWAMGRCCEAYGNELDK